MLGREAKGITKSDIDEIKQYFDQLHQDIPAKFIDQHDKTAHLKFVKIDTPQSLNLGVCASIRWFVQASAVKTQINAQNRLA
jgi:hypothetical protein